MHDTEFIHMYNSDLDDTFLEEKKKYQREKAFEKCNSYILLYF